MNDSSGSSRLCSERTESLSESKGIARNFVKDSNPKSPFVIVIISSVSYVISSKYFVFAIKIIPPEKKVRAIKPLHLLVHNWDQHLAEHTEDLQYIQSEHPVAV